METFNFFFPLELFDIIVLRVRIKKNNKKQSRCVIVVDIYFWQECKSHFQ